MLSDDICDFFFRSSESPNLMWRCKNKSISRSAIPETSEDSSLFFQFSFYARSFYDSEWNFESASLCPIYFISVSFILRYSFLLDSASTEQRGVQYISRIYNNNNISNINTKICSGKFCASVSSSRSLGFETLPENFIS